MIPLQLESHGIAVAIGDGVATVHVFDKPSTCRRVWGRLLSGVVFDSLAAGKVDKNAQIEDVELLLGAMNAATWEQVDAVGEGDEYRAETADDHASALVFCGTVVHGSVAAGIPGM